MKKLLTLPLCILIAQASFGQISIDSANIVHVGDSILVNKAYTFSLQFADAAVSGPDRNWDFSALDSSGYYAMNFIEPAAGIQFNDYSNASFVVNESGGDTVSDYFLKTNEAFSVIGEAGLIDGDTLAIKFNEIYLKFPATYHTSFTNNFADTIMMPGTNDTRLIFSGRQKSYIDGWGKVKMPEGTFPVIRQKVKEFMAQAIQFDSGGGNWTDFSTDSSTDYVYRWWTNDENVKWPLVEIGYDSASSFIQYIEFLNVAPSAMGIQQPHFTEVKVAPNPATDRLNFYLGANSVYRIRITSVSGRQCLLHEFTGNHCQLDIHGLSSGIYFYELADRRSGQSLVGKFIKK